MFQKIILNIYYENIGKTWQVSKSLTLLSKYMDRAWIICIWWRGQKETYFPRTRSFQLKHNICFVVCSTLRYHFSSFINRVSAMSSLIGVGISSFSYAATSLKHVHEKYFWRRKRGHILCYKTNQKQKQ